MYTTSTAEVNGVGKLLTQARALVEWNYDPANQHVRSVLGLIDDATAALARLPVPEPARSPAGQPATPAENGKIPASTEERGSVSGVETAIGHRAPPAPWVPSVSCTR